MEILIKQEVLKGALQNLIPVIDKSSAKPILSNFLMRTIPDQNMVEFLATDHELSLIERFPAEVRAEGSMCVNARKMYDISKEFVEEEVRIQSTEQLWIHVSCGKSQLRLPSVDVGLYPQTLVEDLSGKVSISTNDLKRAIDMTLFAAQTNESRRNLMGVNLSAKSGATRWLATDGHRLAQILISVDSLEMGDVEDVIIPRKALGEVRRSLELFGERVDVSFDERVMQFSGENIVYKTRLIEGKFPNCDPIIPKDNALICSLDRERLMNSLRIVSSISAEKLRPVKLTLSSGKMLLESEKTDYGEVSDELQVEYAAEDFQIGFNSRYLMDVLSVMEEENVKLEFKNPMSPTVIRDVEKDDFLSVIMPLRIEW